MAILLKENALCCNHCSVRAIMSGPSSLRDVKMAASCSPAEEHTQLIIKLHILGLKDEIFQNAADFKDFCKNFRFPQNFVGIAETSR